MKRIKLGRIKLKAFASLAAVALGAFGVTGVAYADSVKIADDMVSVGVYNYDADGDGSYDEGDIIIDARDIQNLAEAVDTLNSEYTTAIAQLSANKFALVKAMDATVTAKNKILADGATDADDISFDSIISTISNLQTPSTATASYYAGGSNGDNSTNGYLASSGSTATSSSVSSGTATINLNTSGASDLTLGVNEQITLESGYYSDPVTVSNGVVNRGSLKSVILTSSSNTVTLEAGYYDTFTVSTDITSASGTITYSHHQCSSTIAGDTYEDAYPDARGAQEVTGLTKVNGVTVSTTSAGCYTKPYYYYKYTASRQVANGYDDCIVCKGSSVADQCTEGFEKKEGCTPHTVYKTEYYAAYAYGSELPSGASIQATYYTKGCGYTNGQIVSATITY